MDAVEHVRHVNGGRLFQTCAAAELMACNAIRVLEYCDIGLGNCASHVQQLFNNINH